MASFGDGLGMGPDLLTAAESAVAAAVAPLQGERPDLLCVFVSGAAREGVAEVCRRAMKIADAGTTLGCSAGGVIGGGRGVEQAGAVAAWAAVLPGVRIRPFDLHVVHADGELGVVGLPDQLPDDEVAVLLADPFTFPISPFVEHCNATLPGFPLVGGLASSAGGRGSVRLFADGKVLDSGAAGVLLGGPVGARTVVSQGCRPIGPTMTVTRAEQNLLIELAGVPAYAKLRDIVTELPPQEQELLAHGLHIGIAIDEYLEEHGRGDFLIRGVLGLDEDSGAVAIGEVVEVGQSVRFQVRDAKAADEDLTDLLTRFRADGPTAGALLFSCNGRGRALFPDADHDVLAVRRELGADGVAGFFAGGEIGPVGRRNHVHGFTASILAFSPRP